MHKSVTIVISTSNQANLLKNTLENLQYLDYSHFEVVVVVNGPPTDDIIGLLDLWQNKIKISYCPEANISLSKNIGIAMSTAEFVAFIDAGVVSESEWLSQVLASFDNANVAAAAILFDRTGYYYQYCTRLGHIKQQRIPTLDYCFPFSFEFPYLQKTHIVFRRSVLLQIGGFNEVNADYFDTAEVCLKLIDAGYLIHQNSYAPPNYAPFYVPDYRRVESDHFSMLKNKIYFSNRYASPFLSQIEIDADNDQFIEKHRQKLEKKISIGHFSESSRAQFEEQVRLAQEAAQQAISQSPQLISLELLTRYQDNQFKQFSAIRPEGKKLTIALLDDARKHRDQARAFAELGHQVHWITCSNSSNTVDLEENVWAHQVMVKSLSNDRADQIQPLVKEIDRIKAHRHLDVIQAPPLFQPYLQQFHEDHTLIDVLSDKRPASYYGIADRRNKLSTVTKPNKKIHLLFAGPRLFKKYPGIELYSLQDNEQRDFHYEICDIFIVSDLIEHNTLDFLQAMMFAKPIVAYRGTAATAMVADSKAGLLATPGDQASLALCLKTLIKDAELRLTLGVNGRNHYEQFCTPHQAAVNALKFYLTKAR